ncbi:hypothetical protein K431DRAFT_231190 [Polychaeton citri CBS 116435]|uniref:Adhesin domain-containing protein n=1 Tax=Polychaeton citri CBS 116435 TaxID=1314669 RepID=A0A9P4Q0F7_9PEZI|nr:hypothetical protein K431DRAFT_231190 [Polychaeton citri CBS 116435]
MGPPSDPHLQHPNTNHCKFVHSSNYYVEQFNLRDMQQANFTIIELIERSRHVNGGVTGTLTIVPVKESEKFDISIVAHMATTAAWKVKGFDIIATDTVFEVREPAFERTGGSQQDPACLDVAIKVYVRKGAVLDNFHVSTLNLGIASEGALFQHGTSQALDDVVSITNSSLLSTVKGNIDLPYWRSRKTYVSSVSGSIKGDYALLDLLSVSSQSGSVRIGVDPQHADKQHPKPAWLKTKTVSGSIDIGLITRSDTPDRDYKTLVTSMSGSIKGTFLLGTEASFETASGSMQLAIHPHEIGQKHPRLSTKTHSGQTTVEIVEPYVSEFYLRSRAEADRLAAQANGMFDSGMLSSLDSSHSTSSASINLKYPDEWTGRIAAQSVSGSIKLKGEGVHVDVAQEIPGFKKTLAHKGFGSGLTDIRSVSGSIDFLAGFVD